MASGPEIVAKLVMDVKELEKTLADTSAKTEKGLKDMAKGATAAFAATFAVDKVVDFGKAAVTAATEDAQAQQQLAISMKNVTGATDEQIAASEKMLSSMSKQTGVADDQLRPAYEKLVRGFKDTEQAEYALGIAMDASVGTGKDLASVSDALMKAANGQTTGLQRLGVATTDASGATLSLDQIMQNMNDTFGGQAAAAAGTTAGQVTNLKVQMSELMETIGHALLPIIQKLMDFLIGTVIPGFQNVATYIKENEDLFTALGIALKATAVVIMVAFVPSLLSMAAASLAAAWPFLLIIAVITLIAFLLKKYGDEIKAFFAAIWDVIGPFMTAIWDVVVSVWNAVWEVTSKVFTWIKEKIEWVFNWIKDNWQKLLVILTGPIGAAVAVIVKYWDQIKDGATAVWNWIKDTFNKVTDAITAPFIAAWNTIQTVWDNIVRGAQEAFDRVTSVFSNIANAITAPIKAAWNGLAGAWNNGPGAASFSVPDWVPGMGGNTFDMPNLPYLAGGGVLTKPTLFVGGEAGTEIVAPEAMLRAIVAEEGGSGAHYELNIYPRTANVGDIAYGFRRLELMAGVR